MLFGLFFPSFGTFKGGRVVRLGQNLASIRGFTNLFRNFTIRDTFALPVEQTVILENDKSPATGTKLPGDIRWPITKSPTKH